VGAIENHFNDNATLLPPAYEYKAKVIADAIVKILAIILFAISATVLLFGDHDLLWVAILVFSLAGFVTGHFFFINAVRISNLYDHLSEINPDMIMKYKRYRELIAEKSSLKEDFSVNLKSSSLEINELKERKNEILKKLQTDWGPREAERLLGSIEA